MSTVRRAVFRVDASAEIGTGHVMRCLTLAAALREAGWDCRFVMRAPPAPVADQVRSRGVALDALPPPGPEGAPAGDGPPHAAWLGVALEREIAESRAALQAAAPDWVIVDHYALDARWETAAVPAGARVVVIDDLADRPHACTLLLDPMLGRRAEDYADLVPADARLLLGPAYAPLRPAFAARRDESLARRKQPELRRLLITMGGVDPENVTGRILAALAAAGLPAGVDVVVVLGGAAPGIEEVKAAAAAAPFPVTVKVDVDDMAGEMVAADLAIGAAGTTSWERCCLGLPTLMLVTAENQRGIARALDTAGAARLVGDAADPDGPSRVAAEIEAFAAPDTLAATAARAATICDGRGAARVVRAMAAAGLALRPATADDAEAVWHWRRADGAERFYRAARETPLDSHLAWFDQALADPARRLLIAEDRTGPVGHVRLDHDPLATAVERVSLCLAPERRGDGRAAAVLAAAEADAVARGIRRLVADIHADNANSLHAFARAGYTWLGEDPPFRRLALDLPPDRAENPPDHTSRRAGAP